MFRLISYTLVFVTGSIASSQEPDRATPVPVNPKPGVYRSTPYVYTLTELPRADGKPILVGSLARNNALVSGGDYYRLELPIGSFIWNPPAEGSLEIGWTRINPDKKYSQWSMAIFAEKKNAQGHWVTLPRDPIKEPPPPRNPPIPSGRGQ